MNKDLKEAWKVLFNFGKPIETIQKEELIELVKEAKSLLDKAFKLMNEQDELISSQNKALMKLQRFNVYGTGLTTYSEKDDTGEWIKYLDLLPLILDTTTKAKNK